MEIIKTLFSKLGFGNALFYPGCLTKFASSDICENYKKILDLLKVEFITLPNDELCCGSPVLNAGYKEDFYKLLDNNKKTFKKFGVSRVITNCPSCNHIFRHYYGLNSEHITQTIFNNLNKLPKRPTKTKITYHDPCHLGRKQAIYSEPRRILEHLGYEVVEFTNNKGNSVCCGGGAGLKSNFPELSNNIAKKLIKQIKTDALVTTCPLCFKQFHENTQKIMVYELSQLILDSLQDAQPLN